MPETPGVAAKVLVRFAGRMLVGALFGWASLLLRDALAPALGLNEPLLPLFPLILLATVIGGVWAGAASLAVGVVGGWYLFMGAPHSFVLAPYELGELVGAVIVGVILLVMCAALFRLVERAKSTAEHQRVIAREFEHRMRNTLTLVQGISRRTFTPTRPLEEARRDFEARLQALSEAHAALLDASGDGAELREIVARILTPFGFGSGEQRFLVEGPKIMLGPESATAIALALHELATNAVKYGALSAPTGQVRVEWRLGDSARPELLLSWRESGGPAVVAPPNRGFGSQLIERSLGRAFGGTAELQFAPEGLCAKIAAPLE